MEESKKYRIVFHGREFTEEYEEFIKQEIQELLSASSEENVIGISVSRSEKLLYLINVLFKKRRPFVILPPDLPEERKRMIIEKLNIKNIVTEDGESGKLIVRRTAIRESAGELYQGLAYCVCTSGSTGVPKIIPIRRDNFISFFDSITERLKLASFGTILCAAYEAFDIFLLETLAAALSGMKIILADAGERKNPSALCRLISENGVDFLQMTPSQFALMEKYDSEFLFTKNIKTILVGGEAFPEKLLRKLQKAANARIYNAYGPAEATIWSTVTDVTEEREPSIGDPLNNTKIHLLDRGMNEVPSGETGEICISGAGIAKGYVGDEDKSAQVFCMLRHEGIQLPIYRTGDLGRYVEDGRLVFEGRVDNQIKINGYRIELEEIEHHVMKVPGVQLAVAFAEERRLVVLYQSRKPIAAKVFLDALKERLPHYMMPHRFIHYNSFKFTLNGKVDRNATVSGYTDRGKKMKIFFGVLEKRKQKKIEKKIVKLIVKVTDIDKKLIQADSSFEELGITSIDFISIIMAVEDEFGIEFSDEYMLMEKYEKLQDFILYVKEKINEKMSAENV